jgi:glycerol-3-phosphate dehydrogenase
MMFLVQHEKVQRLDDLLLRRSMLAMLGRLNRDAVNEIADLTADALGWSLEKKKAEAERTLRLLGERHRVRV